MTSWKTVFYLAALLSMGGYAFSVLRGPQGIPSMQENQRRIRESEQINEEFKRRIREYNLENERLQISPEEREKAVRKHTNKQKPGETTIILPHDAEADEDAKADSDKR
jgi:cell division protein FtsB